MVDGVWITAPAGLPNDFVVLESATSMTSTGPSLTESTRSSCSVPVSTPRVCVTNVPARPSSKLTCPPPNTTNAAPQTRLVGEKQSAINWVPCDFEKDRLPERLKAGRFDPARRCVVAWIGVTMFLSKDAITAT